MLEAKEKTVVLPGEPFSTGGVGNDTVKHSPLHRALRRLGMTGSEDEFLHIARIRSEGKC